MPVLSRLPAGPAIAVEVSVPAFGIWFAAIAATVRADGIFLSMFQEVEAGTRVELDLALPEGGSVKVAGIVDAHPVEGIGIEIAYAELDPETRARIDALVPRIPPAPESGVRTRDA